MLFLFFFSINDFILYFENVNETWGRNSYLYIGLERVNAIKFEFGKTELNFLGHLVNKEGIRPTKKKIEAISKFPIPSTTKQLRRYIGMIQYYHRFVPYAAQLLCPLIDMLKGKPKTDKKLVWTSDFEAVFNKTKTILSQASLLVYPDINALTSLMVDASDVAIGGVLQICLNGSWSPIAFFSRRLFPAQRKYSAFDREKAMYLIVQHFLYFIQGKKFTIFCVQGSENFVADTLSRVKINGIETLQNGINYQQVALDQITDSDSNQLLENPIDMDRV